MSATTEFLPVANGAAVKWADVPEWTAAELVTATAEALARGGRLVAWFGVSEEPGVRLVAVVALDGENTLMVGRSEPLHGRYRALTERCAQAHLFERELFEQHGYRCQI